MPGLMLMMFGTTVRHWTGGLRIPAKVTADSATGLPIGNPLEGVFYL